MTTTVTAATGLPIQRGDYMQLTGFGSGDVAFWGTDKQRHGVNWHRVVQRTDCTCTLRQTHRLAWVEWLRARWEDRQWARVDRRRRTPAPGNRWRLVIALLCLGLMAATIYGDYRCRQSGGRWLRSLWGMECIR